MEHPDRWCSPLWSIAANDHRKPPPSLLWPALAAAAGLAIVFGVALYAPHAFGAETYRDHDHDNMPTTLRLSQAPCTNAAVRGHLEARFPKKIVALFRAATLDWKGRPYASCWMALWVPLREGGLLEMIYSIDEENSVYNPPIGVPRNLFRDDAI